MKSLREIVDEVVQSSAHDCHCPNEGGEFDGCCVQAAVRAALGEAQSRIEARYLASTDEPSDLAYQRASQDIDALLATLDEKPEEKTT